MSTPDLSEKKKRKRAADQSPTPRKSDSLLKSKEVAEQLQMSAKDSATKTPKTPRAATTTRTSAASPGGAKQPAAIAADDDVDEMALAPMPIRPSWAPLPSAVTCAQHGWVSWSPAPLAAGFKKAVVELPAASSLDDALWPAAVAVVNIHSAAQSGATGQQNIVVVVCKHLLTASAIAWAARCRGVRTSFAFSLTDEDMKKAPEEHFADASLILLSAAVVSSETKKTSSDIAKWIDGRTVVVMPDVEDPARFQTMTARGVFLRLSGSAGDSSKRKKPEADDGELGATTHRVSGFGPAAALTPVAIAEAAAVMAPRTDNKLQNAFARGDIKAAIDITVELYNAGRNRCEDALFNALAADWGSPTGGDLLAHHKLAYILRVLCDRSKDMDKSTLEMHTIAIRTVCKCIRMLPPISSASCKTVGDNLPNLTLQATLCHIFDQTSAHVVDALGAAWGIKAVIAGPKALAGFDKKRQEQVHRVRTRFTARCGDAYSSFLSVLMHIVTNATSLWAMSVEEVDHLTQWSAVIEHDACPLSTFLVDALLLPPAASQAGNKSAGANSKSALGKDRQAANLASSKLVRPQKGAGSKVVGEKQGVKVNTQITALPTTKLPLVGTRKREKEALEAMAVEEILSAMPQQPVPMYVGDVGQLIGIWSKFNAKYDGVLPTSLSQFLFDHPEAFRVVQNIVVRVKAGTMPQQKIRYDRDDDGSDSDGEGKTQKGKKVHRRARKKLHLQEVNRRRFDKNHKSFDPESKVPGYKKPRPRAIKGRGRKVNIRRFK